MRRYNDIITGDAAVQFDSILKNPDVDAIRQRDIFISDVSTKRDEAGSIFIECECDFDMQESESSQEEISAIMRTTKERVYETNDIKIGLRMQCDAITRIITNPENNNKDMYKGAKLKSAIAKKQTYKNALIFPKAS